MNVGITGHNGFIGYHLWVCLKYLHTMNVVKIERDFSNVNECDIIVHLAEKNRGNDHEVYSNNIKSCEDLINNFNGQKIIYASSTHENDTSIYGKYRRENKQKFKDWSIKNNSEFVSLQIPNVFGPFCKPNYNSFIATFCYNLINDKEIIINENPRWINEINLVYVQSLCEQIVNVIKGSTNGVIKPDFSATVSSIHKKLSKFKEQYIDNNTIPQLNDINDTNLFNTFRSYMNDRLFSMKSHSDERGTLSETVRTISGGQSFVSTTRPNHVRGQHFHFRKLERFCVLSGKAEINLRKIGTDEVITYNVDGDNVQFIDMPILYTHNIKPVDDDIVAMFWVNELFDENDIDTYWEEV